MQRQETLLLSVSTCGEEGGHYPDANVPIYFSWAQRGQKLHLIRNDSHRQETQDKVKEILGGKKADFLFIDGDHTYEGVRQDFYDYLPLMSERGIVGFHDIIMHDPGGATQVDKFWNELKNDERDYSYDEFIELPEKRWGGIGVIYL